MNPGARTRPLRSRTSPLRRVSGLTSTMRDPSIVTFWLEQDPARAKAAFDRAKIDVTVRDRQKQVRVSTALFNNAATTFIDPIHGSLSIQPLANQEIRRDLAKFAREVHPRVLLDAASRFGQFTGPVRILWGEGDSMFRLKLGRQLSEAFPHAILTTVPGGRTFLPLDHADQVADEIAAAISGARQASGEIAG